ncbi:YcnI family protein [Streptomyces sp. NPDC000594]|uniref:YcnI family copper-binding membrane protein n=1 Tax=Streptomyces sp. NPDC000594 TaxID=3154261 RepID=UPI00331E8AC1
MRAFRVSRTTGVRTAVTAAVTASAVLLLAGPAAAHVSVQPQGEAAQGGYATVNFKVPNERDDSATVKLEINLPADRPMASVLPQPVPGWKVKVTKSKLDKPLTVHGRQITETVSKITWTADGSKIGPGQFQQFPVSLGQLPEDTDRVVFKALQTYDNDEVVRWIEVPQEGAEEPDSPAPVLTLTAPTGDHHGTSAKDSKDSKGSEKAGESAGDDRGNGHDEHGKASAETSGDSDASDPTARILGVVGILAGAVGVAFGVLAGRRRA